MINKAIETYISDINKDKLNVHKNKLTEIINARPKYYKNKDIVYFKKHFKTIPAKIVSRQYKSAKKYKDLYLLFPTYELAFEYYYKLQQKMFSTMSNILDEVIPKVYLDNTMQFADIRNINLGNPYTFDIRPNDLKIKIELNRQYKESLKCPNIKLQ